MSKSIILRAGNSLWNIRVKAWLAHINTNVQIAVQDMTFIMHKYFFSLQEITFAHKILCYFQAWLGYNKSFTE